MLRHSDGGFDFEDRPDGWKVGLFEALGGLDSVVHVSLRDGGDAISSKGGPSHQSFTPAPMAAQSA